VTADASSSPTLRASVIVVNYNGGGKLVDCLQSVVERLPGDSEVIVVDNASTDGSPEAAASRFPTVEVVRSPVNVGYGSGNNLGAASARGRSLVFLNPDTVAERGWLEALLEPLERSAGVGLATARIVLMDQPSRINTCGNEVHVSGLALCRGMGEPWDSFPVAGDVAAVSGAAFAIRKDVFDALGGFDEDFFLYVEDTDLSWRARLAGWKVLYEPASVVRHHYSLRVTPSKVYLQERNRYQMLLKCLRWPTLVALLPALVLAEMVTWGFVLLRDRANATGKLRAYAWVLRHRALIARKRRKTQALRRVDDRELLRQTGFRLDFGQASHDRVAGLARVVFDPLFFVLRGIALTLVRW
jgi:hypothetical protein